MVDVIMLGHSHLGAIREALTAYRTTSGADEIGSQSEHSNKLTLQLHDVWRNNTQYADSFEGGIRFNVDFFKYLEGNFDLSQSQFFTIFGGNGHIVLALERHPRSFDFILPGHEELGFDRSLELLPYEYLKEVLTSMMMPYIWQLIAFREMLGKSFVCIETPPPYKDDDYVKSHLGSYVTNSSNIISCTLRYKMWRLHSEIVENFCRSHDVTFMPVPNAVLDDGKFMKRDGYGADATHANAWYGNEIIKKIEYDLDGYCQDWHVFSEK